MNGSAAETCQRRRIEARGNYSTMLMIEVNLQL